MKTGIIAVVCLGLAAACTPGGTGKVLASSPNAASAFALDSSSVYWADPGSSGKAFADGSISSVPLTGGKATVLASGQSRPCAIAVDATSVYWLSATNASGSWTLLKAPLGGGAATTLAFGSGVATSMLLANDTVFFVTASTTVGVLLPQTDLQSTSYADTALMSVPTGGGTVVTRATGVATSFPYPTDGGDAPATGTLVADSQRVYWADGNQNVLAVSIWGGTPSVLAGNQAHPMSVAVDGENVYWVNHGTGWPSGGADGAVIKMPLGGGTPVVVATAQNAPLGIAVDGTNLYWTTGTVSASAQGQVQKRPLAGGATVSLGTSNDPLGVLVDGSSLYWVDSDLGGSTVRSVAKGP